MQKRFYLEQFNGNDFEAYFSLVNNEKVMAMITERAIPLNEAKENYQSLLEINNSNPNYGSFKIIDTATEAFIGLAKLELNANDQTEAELGYMLLPEFWGKGIGGEVCDQLINLAKESSGKYDTELYRDNSREDFENETQSREVHNLKRLTAIIDPNNLASKKILSKSGFITEFIGDMGGLPAEILAREI